jgi:hypothetical protein
MAGSGKIRAPEGLDLLPFTQIVLGLIEESFQLKPSFFKMTLHLSLLWSQSESELGI